MTRINLDIPDTMDDQMTLAIPEGQSRNEWIRESIRRRLLDEGQPGRRDGTD